MSPDFRCENLVLCPDALGKNRLRPHPFKGQTSKPPCMQSPESQCLFNVATVSNPETTMKTADVQVEGRMAKWNQKLEALYVLPSFRPILWLKPSFSLVQPSSHLTICLYAKRSAHPDILMGTHEMPIPLASQSGSFCREFPPV